MIKRYKIGQVVESLEAGRVTILYGPRRSGKTTILEDIISRYSQQKVLFIRGDYSTDATQLIDKTTSFEGVKKWLSGLEILVIDEAQTVLSIGHILKNIIDAMPGLIVLVSGSSSFELAQQIGEPLVGRKRTLTLYPISIGEIANVQRLTKPMLESSLLYGGYPKVLTAINDIARIDELSDLVESSLLKDIFAYEGIKNARKVRDLLQLLAYTVGSEFSIAKTERLLNIHRSIIERYLDLFEKNFVIFSLGGLSRNLRKEVCKYRKYYFYDLGVRNAVVNNFKPIASRDDVGALWENFCIIERLKVNDQANRHCGYYFWRTYDQQEIDYIEDYEGELKAYEFKYSAVGKVPVAFKMAYPESTFKSINTADIGDFLATPSS